MENTLWQNLNGYDALNTEFEFDNTALQTAILDRTIDQFGSTGGFISGGVVSNGVSLNTINMTAAIAYDANGERISKSAITGLAMVYTGNNYLCLSYDLAPSTPLAHPISGVNNMSQNLEAILVSIVHTFTPGQTDGLGNPLVPVALIVSNGTSITSITDMRISLLNKFIWWGGLTGGSANAQTLTIANFPPTYGFFEVDFIASFTNTSAVTMNINGLGPIPVTDQSGIALGGNQIITGNLYKGIFDGTDLRVQSNQSQGNYWASTIGGSINSYTASIAEFILENGTRITGIIGSNLSNTGASDISINGSGSIAIIDALGNTLIPNILKAGQLVEMIYDGVYWRLLIIGGQAISGTNVIRNSSMMIAQRGTAGTIASGTSGYTLDGWIVGSIGNSTNWTQQLNALMGYQLELSPVNPLTDLYVKQRILSTIIEELGEINATFQIAIYNNTANPITPALQLNIPTATDNYSSAPTNDLTANLQVCLAGQWTIVSYTFPIKSTYVVGLEIMVDFGGVVDGTHSVYVTRGSLNVTPYVVSGLNNYPPVYVQKTYEEELSSSTLYLQILNRFFLPAHFATQSGGVTGYNAIFNLQPFINNPNASYGGNLSDYQIYNNFFSQTPTFLAPSAIQNGIAIVQIQIVATPGIETAFFLPASGAGKLIFSAEL